MSAFRRRYIRVDGKDHAGLTMTALGAIEEDGVGVINFDRE